MLSNLVSLSVSGNPLRAMPIWLSKLKSLEKAIWRDCELTYIPDR